MRPDPRFVVCLVATALALAACNSSQTNGAGRAKTYEEAMELGRRAMEEGNALMAADDFAAARKFQDTPEARHWEYRARGQAAEEKEAWVEAIENYRQALAAKPDRQLESRSARLEASVAEKEPAPRITVEQPPSGAVVETTPIQVVGKVVPGEGAKVKIGGQEVAVVDGTFRATVNLKDGENRLTVAAERFGKTAQESVVVTLKAKGPPLAIFAPAEGAWVSTNEISVEGKVGEPDLEVLVAGVAASVAPDGTFRATVPLPSEGPNDLLVEARKAGAEGAKRQLRVNRDTTPPIVTIVSPAPGTIVEGDSVQVVVEVNDGGDLARVEIAEREAKVTRGRASLDLAVTTDLFTIRVRALDRAGHESIAEVAVLRKPVPRGWSYVGPNARGYHEVTNPKDGGVYIFIPAGPFARGSEEGEGDDNERPRRQVALSGYLIAKSPVTWGQYAAFCKESGTALPTRPAWAGDDHPVVGVTWMEAAAYAQWAGCRLPTEAQWEKAAGWDPSPGSTRKFPWGETPAADGGAFHANLEGDGDGHAQTAPVAAFEEGASPCGALQMAGNVWEWCQDWYGTDYYMTARDEDPLGPENGVDRVIRGGAWNSENEWDLRVAARRGFQPETRDDNLGFRLAKPLSEF
ncbi:MAG: SUMF1/EgtB/PvdO family nonheme iron enzyme [Planctomycetes bacterium]|nr:SUMF1/EgtB/PvdO family nonheme iron enzyme [Planctomycetota bacterium]